MKSVSSYNPHESFSDLLLIVLIIFLLMIVSLSLNVTEKLHVLSAENTFSGGQTIPILTVEPVHYGSTKAFAICSDPNALLGSALSCSFLDTYSLLSIFSAIDPGSMQTSAGISSLIKLNILSKMRPGPVSLPTVNNVQAVSDDSALEILSSLPGEYDILSKETVINDFKVLRRATIYYSYLSGSNKLLVGNAVLSLDEPQTFEFFRPLATSLTDFVYLGEESKEMRLQFFREHGGTEAEEYYKKYIAASSDEITLLSPLIKYPEIAKKYFASRRAQNIPPPRIVKETFLDPLGANLKIVQ